MAGTDNDLDLILARRAAPPPPAQGWEWRIADAAFAAARPATPLSRATGASRRLWDDLGGLFVLPRPAYALAACLVIGIAAGLAAEPVLDLMQQDQGIFIYMEEDAI